jgi:hypothetical protein
MNKSFIAVIGTIDSNTTEEIVLREIAVSAKDKYEAHKVALYKCNFSGNESVFKLTEAATRVVVFEHKKGFIAL